MDKGFLKIQKEMCVGVSLVVQSLRHCTLTAKGMGSIHDLEPRSHIP